MSRQHSCHITFFLGDHPLFQITLNHSQATLKQIILHILKNISKDNKQNFQNFFLTVNSAYKDFFKRQNINFNVQMKKDEKLFYFLSNQQYQMLVAEKETGIDKFYERTNQVGFSEIQHLQNNAQSKKSQNLQIYENSNKKIAQEESIQKAKVSTSQMNQPDEKSDFHQINQQQIKIQQQKRPTNRSGQLQKGVQNEKKAIVSKEILKSEQKQKVANSSCCNII